MEDLSGVQSLETSECLVDEVLAMVIGQLLCANDTMHVRLHEFLLCHHGNTANSSVRTRQGISATAQKSHLNQVHFAEGLEVTWPDNVKDRNDVLVVEMSEQLDLSEGPQTEHRVVKGCDALDGYAGLRWLVNGRAGEKQNRE